MEAAKVDKRAVVAACVMCAALVLVAVFAVAQDRPQLIDERLFPDEALRAAVLESVDADHDGMLSDDESGAVEELDLSSTEVGSLTGLERFANLRKLDASHCGKLSSPDFGRTPGLRELDASNSAVDSLDPSKMSELKSLEAQGSRISELDVSGNAKLTYVGVDKGVSVTGADASSLDGRVCLVSCRSRNVSSLINAMSHSSSGLNEESFEFAYDHERRELRMTHRIAEKLGRTQDEDEGEHARLTTRTYIWDEAGAVVGTGDDADAGDTQETGDGRRYRYDSAGRLVSYEAPSGEALSAYGYDSPGRLVSVEKSSQPGGEFTNAVRYSYDSRGRLVSAVMEDLLADEVFTDTKVEYDAAGRVSSMEDERQSFAFEYDERGRCVAESRRYATFGYSEVVSHEYDSEGRIIRSMVVHSQYDSTCTLDVSCEYDEDGNETHRAYTLSDEDGRAETGSVDFAYAQLFFRSDIAEGLLDSRSCLLCDDPTYNIHVCSPIKSDLLSGQSALVRSALYFAGPAAFGELSVGGRTQPSQPADGQHPVDSADGSHQAESHAAVTQDAGSMPDEASETVPVPTSARFTFPQLHSRLSAERLALAEDTSMCHRPAPPTCALVF